MPVVSSFPCTAKGNPCPKHFPLCGMWAGNPSYQLPSLASDVAKRPPLFLYRQGESNPSYQDENLAS